MSKKMVSLKSGDGEVFDVEQDVALQFQVIKPIIEADCADSVIPLPNVTGKILAKIIEYCKKHVDDRTSAVALDDPFKIWDPLDDPFNILDDPFKIWDPLDDPFNILDDPLKIWDADFVKVDQATFLNLTMAANYLNIKSLLDLTTQTLADMIKGKPVKQIRMILNIKDDFTPEEEEMQKELWEKTMRKEEMQMSEEEKWVEMREGELQEYEMWEKEEEMREYEPCKFDCFA